ncbi:MAG: histidine--tRNA ligase [Anaerolineae bacterium]
MVQYSRLKGTQDILPEDQPYWEHLLGVVAEVARSYGFERIDTPIFEMTELFARGVGEATDIVEKEMYSFKDKGDRDVTLRPEFTAGVIRAYIENGMHVLPKPVKLYSTGPAFRYEEPQAGRYRQFHQFNVEILGVESPLADLEVMLLAWEIFEALDFKNLSFQLNSTGCPKCRPDYVEALQAHYHEHMDVICDNCRRRIVENPLRVLDCKQDQCQPVIASSPKITEMLCDECAEHFAELRGYLDALNRPYTLNHRLVRGLDYYTKTVFEVWAEGIGAQSAVCGGGRYDGLAELLGGPPTPAVGFASGMERIVMVMKDQNVDVPVLSPPPVYLAYLGDASRDFAVELLDQIRDAGIAAQIAMGGSLRSQLRHADRRNAKFTIIIGEDELARGEITLRNMVSGDQTMVPTEKLTTILREKLTA